MKLNKIMLFFILALPCSLILRFLQLNFTIELKTGFFIHEMQRLGGFISVLIIAICALLAFFAFKSYRNPEHPPKPCLHMSITSFLLATAILFELYFESYPTTVQLWQLILLRVTGTAAVIFFFALCLKKLFDFPLPAIISIAPTAYFIMRIICDFTTISSLAIISDNVFLLVSYCSVLLFLLNFAKLYNGMDTENNFKKLLASGLTAVVICFTQSIPYFIINFMCNFKYQHTSVLTNIAILAVGLFILSFLSSHFSKHSKANE